MRNANIVEIVSQPCIKMLWPREKVVSASEVVSHANDHQDSECQREEVRAKRDGIRGDYTYRPFTQDQYREAAEYLDDEGEATFSGDWF
jgi:hypothetical protein